MAMSSRSKFWLTSVLATTFPVWVLPAFLALFVACLWMMIWCSVAEMVDAFTRTPGDDE